MLLLRKFMVTLRKRKWSSKEVLVLTICANISKLKILTNLACPQVQVIMRFCKKQQKYFLLWVTLTVLTLSKFFIVFQFLNRVWPKTCADYGREKAIQKWNSLMIQMETGLCCSYSFIAWSNATIVKFTPLWRWRPFSMTLKIPKWRSLESMSWPLWACSK